MYNSSSVCVCGVDGIASIPATRRSLCCAVLLSRRACNSTHSSLLAGSSYVHVALRLYYANAKPRHFHLGVKQRTTFQGRPPLPPPSTPRLSEPASHEKRPRRTHAPLGVSRNVARPRWVHLAVGVRCVCVFVCTVLFQKTSIIDII